VRLTHDDGVELTFDNIVNDSSLYGSDVLIRKNRFVSENQIGIFFLNRNALVSIQKTADFT